jgi:hypothetical protein
VRVGCLFKGTKTAHLPFSRFIVKFLQNVPDRFGRVVLLDIVANILFVLVLAIRFDATIALAAVLFLFDHFLEQMHMFSFFFFG